MITAGLIKTIQDIMRKDEGVDGDAQRLSQLVWLIFLKVLDDSDTQREIMDKSYVSAMPAKFQWRNWAADPAGITGGALLDFVNNELFPELSKLPTSTNKRTDIIRAAFEGSYNYMKNGTLLRQVINKINEVNFNSSDDRHTFNDVYENLLASLQNAGNAGEYYTPRPVTRFIVEMVDPHLGETVFDPACGTGGVLGKRYRVHASTGKHA